MDECKPLPAAAPPAVFDARLHAVPPRILVVGSPPAAPTLIADVPAPPAATASARRLRVWS